jgi:hypothetical protein
MDDLCKSKAFDLRMPLNLNHGMPNLEKVIALSQTPYVFRFP